MPNELIQQDHAQFSQEDIALIKETVCKGATDTEFKLFMNQARTTGLNPLARQVFAVMRWDWKAKKEVMSIQVSIDGFRLIAERTGKYAGQVGPFWCGEDGLWRDAWLSDAPPVAARVGALRSDFKEPCWGVARFNAYAQKTKDGTLTKIWATMGDTMIAKCAESLALRKAFPQELSGLYTNDEMGQAEPEKSAMEKWADTPPPQIEHLPENPFMVWMKAFEAALPSKSSKKEIEDLVANHSKNLSVLHDKEPELYENLIAEIRKYEEAFDLAQAAE